MHAGSEILREQYAPSAWDTSFANVYVGQEVGQSFTAHTSFLLTHLELLLFDQPQPSSPDILQVFIAADAGDQPGAVLASTAQQGPQRWSWVPFGFYPWVPISAGQRYWILASDSQPRPKGYEWAMNAPGDYAYGDAQWYNPSSGTWTNNTGADLFFKVYGISGPALYLQVDPMARPVDRGTVVPIDVWFNNSGNEAAGTVSLSMALAGDLIYVGDDASSAGGVQSAPLAWSFSGVSVGPHKMTVWVQVDPSAKYYDGESLTAVVDLSYTDALGAPQTPLRAVASVTVLIPVIRVQAEPMPAHVDPGQRFNFTVSFIDVGSGSAAYLWLNASAGPRLTILGDDAAAAGGLAVGTDAWRFQDVDGQSYGFNVTVRADPAAWPGDRLSLNLNLSYTDGLGHPVADIHFTASASIHGPSLVVGATVDEPRPHPGDVIQVVLYANNTGDQVASRAWLNNTFPSWTTFEGSQPSASAQGNGTLGYVLSNVRPGPFAVTIRLKVQDDAPPGVTLKDSAHLDVANGSGVLLRPSSAIVGSTVVTPRFAIGLESSAASVVHPGDRVDLTLRINNSGNEAARRAWVNLTLPRNTLLVNSTLPWAATNGTVYGWTLDNLGPGERTIGVRIEVSARLADREDLVGRLDLTYLRSDGAVFSLSQATISFQGAAAAGVPASLEMLLLWVAILAALFLLFLLLAYMDVLPHRRTSIDDVFLLHNSGILICHYSTTLHPDVDSDIASGMLMAVRNFVADALRTKNGALQELRYGDYRIHMAHGQYAILVVFTRAGSPKNLDVRMAAVLRNIETLYGKVLESWSGRTEDFKGVEEVLLKLVEA